MYSNLTNVGNYYEWNNSTALMVALQIILIAERVVYNVLKRLKTTATNSCNDIETATTE